MISTMIIFRVNNDIILEKKKNTKFSTLLGYNQTEGQESSLFVFFI